MTRNQKLAILNRINEYADEVLEGVNPERSRVSDRLAKLRPVMEELAKEYNKSLAEIFVIYMDMNTQTAVEEEQKYQTKMKEADY